MIKSGQNTKTFTIGARGKLQKTGRIKTGVLITEGINKNI
jgi:hypothetical protein